MPTRGCAQRLFYGPLPLVARRCRRTHMTHAQHVLTRKRRAYMMAILVSLVLWGIPAPAQDLVLTKDSEPGFWRLIDAAQAGQLGDDVSNANVGALFDKVRIELVRKSGAPALLYLTRKRSTQPLSRYFDIEIGAGATAADAARVGTALDEAFHADPFAVSFDFFGARSGESFPTVAAAWKYGGWRRVVGVLEDRLTAPAGVGYTAAVIIASASALLASLMLLWGAEP